MFFNVPFDKTTTNDTTRTTEGSMRNLKNLSTFQTWNFPVKSLPSTLTTMPQQQISTLLFKLSDWKNSENQLPVCSNIVLVCVSECEFVRIE